MTRDRLLGIGLLLGTALLAGCDPFTSPYFWRPSGANETNLGIMAAEPRDLAHGQGAAGAEGHSSAVAVYRLRRGQPRPLPSVDGTQAGLTTGGPDDPAAGAAAPPAAP